VGAPRQCGNSPLTKLCQRCDICPQGLVGWPGIFTAIGQLDLCGICYWRYRDLTDQLAAFFRAEHVVR
jgi:hypothetical protein